MLTACTPSEESAPCVNGLNLPVPCAGAPLAYAGLPYAAQYGKREAEADPQVILGGLGYGLGYHAGVAAVAPAVLGHAALPNPVHAVAATPAGLVHSSHVGLCTNYLGAAVPCRRKRSAEPHHGYGFHGLPHGLPLGYKSAPCVNAANHPVPCASALHHHHHHGHHYKKREADADAQVILGGLGYHGVVAAPAVAPAVVAAAPVVAAPVAVVHNAVLGTADLPNPVHAVAHTIFGAVHSSHIGVCTNYLGEQVSC